MGYWAKEDLRTEPPPGWAGGPKPFGSAASPLENRTHEKKKRVYPVLVVGTP